MEFLTPNKKLKFLSDAQKGEIARFMIEFPEQKNITIARIFEEKFKWGRPIGKDVLRRLRDKKNDLGRLNS